MGILKKKLALIQGRELENPDTSLIEVKLEENIEESDQDTSDAISHETQNHKTSAIDSPSSKVENKNAISSSYKQMTSNNIMKNYCRAILNFALSPLALQYLTPLLEKYKITARSYRLFIQCRRGKLNCIKQLRGILLSKQKDTREASANKKIFQEIIIIFLKFFVPNWLYNSTIAEKTAHLKFRFRILRRVRDPLHFTYLQGF